MTRVLHSLFAAVLACSALTSPARAQVNYPTAAGSSVKVPGVVPLQCNASGAACAPVTASNPAGPNQVVGNVAAQAADSGNPVKAGGKYSAAPVLLADGNRGDLQLGPYGALKVTLFDGTASAIAAPTPGDAASNNVVSIVASAYGSVFNGTSWDRTRSIVNATNSTGTGIIAAGQLAQLDDTSPTAITENQFGNVRMGAQRQQLNAPLGAYPYSAVLAAPAVPVRGASGNVANAAAVATLTGTATTTVYIAGFTCTPGGATAAALVDLAVTGTLGGTLTYTAGTVAGAALISPTVSATFNPPYPASAVNTPIVVTMPALGAGNAKAACVATGFYM